MVNSHYVPQLILRHFSDADRIQYCDLTNRKVETRNIRSTFAEKGYYPDEIEKEMCYKAESQFANLLNNKLLNERRRIILTRDELFILKKSFDLLRRLNSSLSKCRHIHSAFLNHFTELISGQLHRSIKLIVGLLLIVRFRTGELHDLIIKF